MHETATDLDPAWGVPVKVTGPNNKVTTGTYDALGRLTQVWKPAPEQGDFGLYVVESAWSTYGQLEYMDLGTAYSYQYALGYEYGTRRLMDVRQSVEKADGTVPAVLNSKYIWDKAGNLTGIKDNPHEGAGSPDRQCFTYDWARRLSQAWAPASGDRTAARTVGALGGADPYWNSYSYEVTGNRETVTARTPDGITSAQYVHPAQGQSSVRPHAVTSVTTTGQAEGVSQFTWDAAGSMTGRVVPDGEGGQATQSLTWDAEGELRAVGQDGNADGDVADAGEAVAGGAFVYTADGERLVRTQGSGTARKTTVYLPGGQEVTTSASGQVSAVRYYSFAGQTVAMRTGMLTDEMVSITPDHHGTGSLQITNLTNTVTRRYVDPFGAERGAAGPSSSGAGTVSGWAGDHGFLDKPADVTGLTAVGARMYDPGLGAFISVDPVMDLADPQQWNAYAYSNNNPTTRSDPTGLYSGIALDPGSGGGCGCDNGYEGSDDDSSNSPADGGGNDVDIPVLVYPILSPEQCPGCWGLVPVREVTYPDHRPQWLVDFEGAHPNIATYSGISDYSGCFLRGGIDDSCAVVGLGVVLAPFGGALAGAGIKVGVKALVRTSTKAAGSGADETLETVYRVYGGDSAAGGASWSPVNPKSVPNYRGAAGLPSGGASGMRNSGQFVIEGKLVDPGKVVRRRAALPLDGRPGGLPEYIIPNWMDNGAVRITRVSGANPEF